MPVRPARVLIAFIIALAMMLLAGARAMPMQPGPMQAGISQPCQECPDHSLPNQTPGKMTLCQLLVCAGPLLAVPATPATSERIAYRVAYPAPRPDRMVGVTPALDPFPPRPVVLR